MNVLITGANGFVGKNLQLHLAERNDVSTKYFLRNSKESDLPALLEWSDFVFHLAGVNRPQDVSDFQKGNSNFTKLLSSTLAEVSVATGKKISLVFSSSSQASFDNPYGKSKALAEQALREIEHRHSVPVHIYRLPNVFGKWCKPNYNSVVATFCHNIARDLPIKINDPSALIRLVFVDDLIESFIRLLDGVEPQVDQRGFVKLQPQYNTSVGEIAKQIYGFKESRVSLMTNRVGTGLERALYSTYVSYLPIESFVYSVPHHGDERGIFVEMLKTPDCGQFSFFTAHPGITRGGHYHHAKTEKFLVIKGEARFKFRHMQTGQIHELVTSGAKTEVVETVPGWTHDITNIGDDEMVVMLWANEIFDRHRPDTFHCPL